jgi:hypothetical protein
VPAQALTPIPTAAAPAGAILRDVRFGRSWILAACIAAGCEPRTRATAVEPDPIVSNAPPPAYDAAPAERVAARGAGAPACVGDPTVAQACAARGPGFTYGPPPFIVCSGAAVDTGALAQRHADAARNRPCRCNDETTIAARRAACAAVPSRPGR